MLQEGGSEREHAAVARRNGVQDAVRMQHLVRLTRIAKRYAKEEPALAGRFTLPRHGGPHRAFLIKANGMLADAIAQKELLGTLGLGDSFIDELTQAVAELEQATADAHAARNDQVGAAAQLEQLATIAAIDVGVLDTYMRRLYVNDAMSLAAWRSARNLAGPFRSQGNGVQPVPSPTPIPEPEPVPAPSPSPVTPPVDPQRAA